MLQWWVVPKTSVLCMMNLTSTDKSRIGLQTINSTIYLSLAGTNRSIDDYWLSEGLSSNSPVSVQVPGPDENKIYFITLEETTNK